MSWLRLCVVLAFFQLQNLSTANAFKSTFRNYVPPSARFSIGHRLPDTPISVQENFDDFIPPKFPKTEDEEEFIKSTLLTNFMFQNLPDEALDNITRAFERVEYQAGENIVTQGDTNAEYFFLISQGQCSVAIDGKVLVEPYGTLRAGSVFGELALLYDAARAATIATKTAVTCYRVDRRSFLYFLNGQSGKDVKEELLTIDQAIDRVAGVKMRYGGSIIQAFNPRRRWLWRRWAGTVLQHTWKDAVGNMLLSVAAIVIVRRSVPCTWLIGMAPDASHPVIARLAIFGKLWHYLMTLTTFILTFFLSQAYSLWRQMYTTGRVVQGRLNDIGLLAASSATRDPEGNYTPEAEATLDDIASFSRLFHAFMWANFSKQLRVLATPRGMSRMLSRGLMTKEQFSILKNLAPQVGAANVCLEWLTIRAIEGTHDGSLKDDDSLRRTLYDKLCILRGTAAGISDTLDGRMPLAYAHFVQILVDTFLLSAPLALYAELGVLSILCAGLLTLFYSGLLALSKVFLDPLSNDDYYKESINMDIGVLIRESNAGSTRWKGAASMLPF